MSPLRILLLEDNSSDAELIQELLEAEHFVCEVTRVQTRPEFLDALENQEIDLILADYKLPSFDGLSALNLALSARPDLPFIFVSGTLGEEVAIEALKIGATDYVLKTRLSRLVPSVHRAVREARERVERKKAKEALRQSEAYLAEAQHLSHTGSFGWNVLSGEIYWSDETYRIFEYEPTTKPTVELVIDRTHPDDRMHLRQIINRASIERTGFTAEPRLIMLDGAVKYVQVVAHRAAGENPEGLLFVGAVTDITEHKRAEETLREQANLLSLTHDAIFVRDMNGAITYWNRGAEELYGWPAEQAVGKVAQQLLKRASSVPFDQIEEELMRTGRWQGELLDRKEDGTAVDVASRWSLRRDEKGAPIAILVTNNDITERKRAEQALIRSEAYLAEAQRLTHTGSWAFRADSKTAAYWSEENFRIWGFAPQQGPPDRETVLQRVHSEDRDRVIGAVQSTMREGRDYAVEFRIVLPDGTVRHLLGLGHAVFNPSGEPVQVVGTDVDVTERKLAEEERERLHRLETDLAHMNRVSMMGELAGSLAHEIKQPITAAATNARTCLRWLQRQPPEIEEARETASRIVKDVTRAADIIDRNRCLYSRGTPRRELANLNGLIRQMVLLLNDRANQHSISIRAELDPGLPAIAVDCVQIQQVLMNLMLNGIEAMQDASGELTVTSKRSEDSQVVISVSDSGIGFPVEEIERVFEAFFTTKPQGTGMGLSISRRIIESHGGRLWASAKPGRGATFQFTLPNQVTASSPSTA
jgi:PAS domain S-box-containing protein